MSRARLLLCALLAATSCSGEPEPEAAVEGATPAPDPVATAIAVAGHYVDGYYRQFPEEAYESGYPDTPMDRFGDRSMEAMAAWHAREDAWLDSLRALDADAMQGTDAAVPYAFALDRLEAAANRRVCRTELWNVSPTWTGWQSMLASTMAAQPVASEADRRAALSRARDIARYLDTEIANLRAGVREGFVASGPVVAEVIRQVDALLSAPPEESPFYDPATRTDDGAFGPALAAIVVDEVRPAMTRYRDYLAQEYSPRRVVGVSANPEGEACYRASVRYHTSLDRNPRAIHDDGLREMERIQGEMLEIARSAFATDDVAGLLRALRTDARYTFRSEDEVLAYARSAVDRAETAVGAWFGFVPDAELTVRPFPAYQQASGGGFYSSGAVDGSRPGTYEIGTYRPEAISRAGIEATAFHESYPGHHLQMSVALFGRDVHPVLRYFYVPGMGEGWGLYAERLADEMGLYSSELDRLGMLSNEALRAARLVVDPGMHVMGWTRGEAVEYMLSHTAESQGAVAREVDRYLAVPGQATAYLTGSLEIQQLRRMAEERLGPAFDVRSFHDRVLADGGVTLPMLRDAIEAWIVAQGG